MSAHRISLDDTESHVVPDTSDLGEGGNAVLTERAGGNGLRRVPRLSYRTTISLPISTSRE